MRALVALTLAGGASAECDYGHDKSYGWNKRNDDPTDAAAMKDLANALHFRDWARSDGWELFMNNSKSDGADGIFSSMCSVDNVCCDKIDGKNRVVALKLERNKLKGKFPDTFIKLAELKEIDAHLNFITNFPKGLETMPKLRQAKFGRNPITGTVPAEWKNFGPQLEKLNCNFCALEGEFPDIFDNKPKLEEAYWNGNGFTGSLPPSLAKLSGLTKISLNLNSFTGEIPAGLCALPLLHDCRIGGDTSFKPYDTSEGSPEKAWLKKWTGNVFSCPSSCVTDNICNNGGPAYQPGHYGPESPLKCTGPSPSPPSPTPPSPPPAPPAPTPAPSPPAPTPTDCDGSTVDKCVKRCEQKYGGKFADREEAYKCSKGCAEVNNGQFQDKLKYCKIAADQRAATCKTTCKGTSSDKQNIKMCEYGCGFWSQRFITV